MFNCGLTFRNISLSLPAEAASDYFQEDAMKLYQHDHNTFKRNIVLFRKCQLHVQHYERYSQRKNVRIRSYSSSYFSAFRPNTERYPDLSGFGPNAGKSGPE